MNARIRSSSRRESSGGIGTETSPLDAEHLLQLGDDLHQVLLVLHHLLDGLVRAGNLVEQVMEYQKDLVEVVAELKQVLCVKG